MLTMLDTRYRRQLELETKIREDFTITEKAPTRAFSWLKALTYAFTLKTLLRHYAEQYRIYAKQLTIRVQAILQNGLIEATLAGGWISVLLWVGSIIFIIIQRTYIRREKNKFDRFSEHNTMMDSMRQKEGSMISGATGYYSGNMSNFVRGK